MYEALSYLFIIRSVLRGCVSGCSYLAICAIYSVCYLIRFRMRRCVSGCSYLAEGDAQWSELVNSAKLTKPLCC